MEVLKNWSLQLKFWLMDHGFAEMWAELFSDYFWVIVLFCFATITYYITRWILFRVIKKVVKKTSFQFDDYLYNRRFFRRMCYFAPAVIIYLLAPVVITDSAGLIHFLQKLMAIYMIFVAMISMDAFINATHDLYLTMENAKSRPIKGFLQVVKIIIYSVGVIIIISVIVSKKPAVLLGGLGAVSAILILVFKDSILGFVAGIQLIANNMVKIGDWITLPKHDIDGTVAEINLTTVKIQNFDKTISTIPTYTLITDAVKNWRGMEESGGRRITRSINIDMSSIKFCTPELLDKFVRIKIISDYIKNTENELKRFNLDNEIDNEVLVNGRRQTNIGVFRAYLKEYLLQNPNISNDMTMIVRQMAPTEKGIPIQLYCFAISTEWVAYESIQSDIFDHVMAIVPFFELKVFQNPSGSDFKSLLAPVAS